MRTATHVSCAISRFPSSAAAVSAFRHYGCCVYGQLPAACRHRRARCSSVSCPDLCFCLCKEPGVGLCCCLERARACSLPACHVCSCWLIQTHAPPVQHRCALLCRSPACCYAQSPAALLLSARVWRVPAIRAHTMSLPACINSVGLSRFQAAGLQQLQGWRRFCMHYVAVCFAACSSCAALCLVSSTASFLPLCNSVLC